MLARTLELDSRIDHEPADSCGSMVCKGQSFEIHRAYSVQRIEYPWDQYLHARDIEEQRHDEHVQNLVFSVCFFSFCWVSYPHYFWESEAQSPTLETMGKLTD